MDEFYAARSGIIPPLPWTNFAPPLSGLERAARNPTVTIVEKLAKSLGVTASDLLR